VFIFFVFIIILSYVYSEYFLSILLVLEFISLIVYLFMLISFSLSVHFFSLYYLVFSVCEGALGLSLLVIISLGVGGDYVLIVNSSY